MMTTDREPPVGYERPLMWESPPCHFYLEPQANYEGATPQFMIMHTEPGCIRLLAEKCLLKDATLIVDALRDTYAAEVWGAR